MKKSKIVVGIVVVVLLVLVVWLITVMNNQRISPNKPFDYMKNLKMYGYNNYENLSTGEKKMVYSIPEDVSETLSTEALLETILNNEYLIDLFAYDNFVKAVQSREEQFRIMEFLKRKDSIDVLGKYIEIYGNDYEETDSVVSLIKYTFLKRVNDNFSNILGITDSDKNEKDFYTR